MGEIIPMKQEQCPECGHTYNRYRLRTRMLVCYRCGHTWKPESRGVKSMNDLINNLPM